MYIQPQSFINYYISVSSPQIEGVEKQMTKLTRERDFNTILSDPKQRGRYGQ